MIFDKINMRVNKNIFFDRNTAAYPDAGGNCQFHPQQGRRSRTLCPRGIIPCHHPRRIALLAVLLLVLAACVGVVSADISYDLGACGDSIGGSAYGYVKQMRDNHNESATYISIPFSGRTTSYILGNISTCAVARDVYIMGGVNDRRSSMTGLQTAQNLEAIYNSLIANNVTPHIEIETLMSPDGTDARQTENQISNITIIENYLTSVNISFGKTYDYIDSVPNNGLPDAADATLLKDGIHPTQVGQLLISEGVWYGSTSNISIFYIASNDGRLTYIASTAQYPVVRNSTSGSATATESAVLSPFLGASTTPDIFSSLRRTVLPVNTSGIPDNDIIDRVVLSIQNSAYVNSLNGTYNLTLTGGILLNNSALSNGDYPNFTNAELANRIEAADLKLGTGDDSTRNLFVLNPDGRSWVNKSGYTIFYLRDGWDLVSSFDGIWLSGGTASVTTYFSEDTLYDGDRRPYLEVFHHPPPITATFTPAGPLTTWSGIAFRDTSTGSPTAWNWSYKVSGVGPDIPFNNTQHATFFPTSIGDFTISLNASNAFSYNISTQSTTVTVVPPSVPVASFNANVTSGRIPLAVQFTDTSLGNPTSWMWVFSGNGDVAQSVLQSPVVVFSNPGVYSVNLTATNGNGTTYLLKQDYITVVKFASQSVSCPNSSIIGAFTMLGLALMVVGGIIMLMIFVTSTPYKDVVLSSRSETTQTQSMYFFGGSAIIICGSVLLVMGIVILSPIIGVTGC
jgi:PKD repeat protein